MVVNWFKALWDNPPQPIQNPPRAGPRRPPAFKSDPPTVLQQDPICGMYVAADTSLKKIVGGRVIHFCSQECRERYLG